MAGAMLASLGRGESWTQIDGGTFDGDLLRCYGPWAHFSRGDASFLRLVRQLSEADQARVRGLSAEVEAEMAQDWGESESYMTDALEGRVFHLEKGKKRRFRFKGKQEPEFYVLYYAAGWSPLCIQFTPALVATYKQLRIEGVDNFEVFFFSGDRRRPDQFLYMRDAAMEWPAVDLNRMRGMEIVRKYQGSPLPCLVIVDREGRILAHTNQGGQYVGPGKVLTFLNDLLYWTNPENPGLAIYRFGRVCERILSDPPEAVRPMPFFVTLGDLKNASSTLRPVHLQLAVTRGGQVESVKFPEDMQSPQQAELEAIIKTWLFLPRISKSEPVSCEIEATIGEFLDWAKTAGQQQL